MSVYIGAATGDDYSAMRGPCPKGFHVGTKSEWELIINSGVAFSAWNTTGGANFSTYLKMPAGGYRTGEGASVSGSNDMGYYWTCTQYNSTYNTYSNYGLYFRNSNGLSGISVSTRNGCIGAMIRGIKDVPVEPDSSWTTLISSGEDGIYHSATLGLISMVYSGFVYTIADKNVGATTVYNFNDTMSEANCGKFFQMGNNYQFPYSGTLTTSSTQVNASNYGPGNYYSSSTFITGSSGWDSSQNKDLWGGETGVQQTPKELKSAYIGEYVDYLCFTANTAGSIVKIHKVKSPADVTLEFSTDGSARSTYTFSDAISLANIGDKVYFRNTSETDVQFSIDEDNYYKFEISGSVSGSGNITTLLNKNGTLTLSDYCFYNLFNSSALATPPDIPVTTVGNYSCGAMFRSCSNLTTVPKLPALNIGIQGYGYMFYDCTSLTTINELPATTLNNYCYAHMYRGCTQIKLSSTQTGDYQTEYRIPSSGTGSGGTYQTNYMFLNTGGTLTGTPYINTTYYTSNTII